ncbi:unnamed protein product [Nippostrongylus brasiliensis]|uniref:Transposase n=1 Tax=Nippostrongylus brasiliensis TaxID=27835 RepID=A0A0N4XQL0_NIPBR|nr:unnamed protein product [Nippostrongylus brasiliensis]
MSRGGCASERKKQAVQLAVADLGMQRSIRGGMKVHYEYSRQAVESRFTIKKQRFVTSQPTRRNITLPRRKNEGVNGDQQLAEGCDVKHRLAYTPTQTVALGCYWKG